MSTRRLRICTHEPVAAHLNTVTTHGDVAALRHCKIGEWVFVEKVDPSCLPGGAALHFLVRQTLERYVGDVIEVDDWDETPPILSSAHVRLDFFDKYANIPPRGPFDASEAEVRRALHAHLDGQPLQLGGGRRMVFVCKGVAIEVTPVHIRTPCGDAESDVATVIESSTFTFEIADGSLLSFRGGLGR